MTNFCFVLPGRLAGCAHPALFGHAAMALEQLRDEGVGAIVSLDEHGLPLHLVAEHGFDHLHVPVPDFKPPELTQVREFVAFVASKNAAGVAVVAHCAAGIGRTGTMLACALVAEGATAAEAMARVRALRPGSIETRDQERRLAEYARSVRKT